MNGRLALTTTKEELETFLGVKANAIEATKYFSEPQYNIAPSGFLGVLTNLQPDKIRFFKWGLIPSWTNGNKNTKGLSTIEIQAFSQKPALQKALKNKRCLIVLNGFYLWKDSPAGKIPYLVTLKSKGIFCVAGLWESWEEEDSSFSTCCLLTKQPSATLSYFSHDMPFVLQPKEQNEWLSKDISDIEALYRYQSIPEIEFEYYPVNRRIIKSLENDPKFAQKISYIVAEQTSLF